MWGLLVLRLFVYKKDANQMSRHDNNEQIQTILFQLSILIILLFFFLRICPVIPYDGDDWYFAGAMRWPFPLWGVFNPTKVLPETLEPFCGYIAAYLVYPIVGDYVASLSYVMGSCIAIISFIFFLMLCLYLKKKHSVPYRKALAIELIVLLSMFLIFKQRNAESYYAFWSLDVNCCFNYVVPGLFNGIMVFALEIYNSSDNTKSQKTIINSLLLAGTYFAVFSNIVLSIIIAVYAATDFLECVLQQLPNFKKIDRNYFLSRNKWNIGILIAWMVSLIYEFNGGRAKVVTSSSFWGNSFKDTLSQMNIFANNINRVFGIIVIVIVVFAIILSKINSTKGHSFDKRILSTIRKSFLVGIIIFIYLLLLFTKLGGNHATRPDCMWALQYVVYWIIAVSLAEILTRFSQSNTIIPLLVIIMTISAFNLNNPFKSSNGGRDYMTCKAIDDYIINQIVEADCEGLSYIEVKVPLEQSDSNWPHPYNMAQWMQNTLYAHGMIHRRITIVFVPDSSVNDLFYSCDGIQMPPFYDLEAW